MDVIASPYEDISNLEAEATALEASGADEDGGTDAAADASAVASGGGATASASTSASPSGDGGGSADPDQVKAAPRAKKRAGELDIDLTTVEGIEPGGAVVGEDVEADDTATWTVRPEGSLGQMRTTIASRLGESIGTQYMSRYIESATRIRCYMSLRPADLGAVGEHPTVAFDVLPVLGDLLRRRSASKACVQVCSNAETVRMTVQPSLTSPTKCFSGATASSKYTWLKSRWSSIW